MVLVGSKIDIGDSSNGSKDGLVKSNNSLVESNNSNRLVTLESS
jgi:hypothetical protein